MINRESDKTLNKTVFKKKPTKDNTTLDLPLKAVHMSRTNETNPRCQITMIVEVAGVKRRIHVKTFTEPRDGAPYDKKGKPEAADAGEQLVQEAGTELFGQSLN